MATPAFRRPPNAAPPAANEPDDLEHLLDALPEVPTTRDAAQAGASNENGLHDVLEQVRHHMESAFGDGLARIEGSIASLTRDTDARVQAAQAQLQLARGELERARADYERKADALRELKKTLESL